MDEKECYDTNREARHDAAANRNRPAERRADVIGRFVGALLYSGTHPPEREHAEPDGKLQPEK